MRIRPTVATIDLAALRHNLEVIRSLAGEARICAVVKADAYGHGLLPVGRALAEAGVDWLAVALLEEGLALRQAGIAVPVLVMGAALAGGYDALVEHSLTPVLFRADQLHSFAAAARGAEVRFHLKLDTGMARLGLAPAELGAFLDTAARHANLRLDGVMTHLANADLQDEESNHRQLVAFDEVRAQMQRRGLSPHWVHAANSAAVLTSDAARCTLVRPGLLIYGMSPLSQANRTTLMPVMRWTTQPVHIKRVKCGTRVSYGGRWQAKRDSVLATLPVGYADGYPRAASGKAEVLVRGHRVPVVGTICMDLCVVDVTDVADASLEDEVVLLGQQENESITAHDMARWAGTIPYEIVCGVGARVPRAYVGEVS